MHSDESKSSFWTILKGNKLAIAAAILFILVGLAWLFFRNTEPDITPQQFAQNQFSEIEIDLTRNLEDSIANILKEGELAYLNQQFDVAKKKLSEIPPENPFYQKAQLYLGYTFIKENDWNKAIDKFENLSIIEDAAYKEEAEWFDLLSTIMSTPSSNEILNKINRILSNENHLFYKEALELKKLY